MASSDSSEMKISSCPVINTAVIQEYPFDIYVGTSTGFLKGCRLDKQKSFNINNVQASHAKQLEITCMNWWNNDDSNLLVARRDGYVFRYETESGSTFRVPIEVSVQSSLIKSIKSDDKLIATAFSNGVVKCNSFDMSTMVDEESPTLADLAVINAGADLSCMDYNTSHLIVTGGKENPLKIWDLTSSKKPIFTAKNVKNDWLNLRVPVWITNAQFVPESNKVVSSTGLSQIRLYDPLVPQRRPVIEIQLEDKNKKYPITALAARPNSDLQFIVGTTVGTIALADFRTKNIVKHYKRGTGGGIMDLKFHPTYPMFASCGMDSYLHCFDMNSSKRTHSMYLHSTLNCVLFSSQLSLIDNKETVCIKQGSKPATDAGSDSDNGDVEDVWKGMEVVQTKKRKVNLISSERNKKRKRNKTVTGNNATL